MREAEENIKFKMEIDVLVPIPRTVTRDFTSLKHLRQWQKRNDIDGSLYCFAHREYLLNEKGEWEQFTDMPVFPPRNNIWICNWKR